MKVLGRRTMTGMGLLAAGAIAGGVLAGTIGASAATGGTSTSGGTSTGTTTAGAPAAPPGAGPRGNPMSSGPVRSDEKAVSSSQDATLRAAALKAVPGGTVYRIETDAGDAAYEAHMTKADGTRVTVKFDKDLNVVKVEDGMGQGDPAPAGAPGGSAPPAPGG